jgi:rubrerythrin
MAIFQASDAIEMALEIETRGEAFYRAVAKKAKKTEVKGLFEDLAEQEVLHRKTFEKLSKTQWAQPLMPDTQWDQYLVYLQATIQNAFFAGEDKSLALAEQAQDEKEALRMAMGFEKETLLFFHDLREMVSEADEKTIKSIVDEEKAHLRRLADMLK